MVLIILVNGIDHFGKWYWSFWQMVLNILANGTHHFGKWYWSFWQMVLIILVNGTDHFGKWYWSFWQMVLIISLNVRDVYRRKHAVSICGFSKMCLSQQRNMLKPTYILPSVSLVNTHYMFRSYWPSSGVKYTISKLKKKKHMLHIAFEEALCNMLYSGYKLSRYVSWQLT